MSYKLKPQKSFGPRQHLGGVLIISSGWDTLVNGNLEKAAQAWGQNGPPWDRVKNVH